jgi:hypothetical protein
MKFSKDLVDYIRNVIKVARLAGIESVAIERIDPPRGETKNVIVRAIDENKTVVICHTDTISECLPVHGIGIGRLDLFSSRLALVMDRPGFVTEAEVISKDGQDQVSRITFKAQGIKVDYRCANTVTIRAPKAINDPIKYEFTLDTDSIDTLIKAQNAMGVDFVTVISNESKGMCFELMDANKDIFSHEFSAQAVSIVDRDDVEFVHRYPIKSLIPLIKQNSPHTIQVSERGIMKIDVSGINVFVLPVH